MKIEQKNSSFITETIIVLLDSILQHMLPDVYFKSITCVQKRATFPPKFSLRKEEVAMYLNSLNVSCIMGYSSNYLISDNILVCKHILEFEITLVDHLSNGSSQKYKLILTLFLHMCLSYHTSNKQIQ